MSFADVLNPSETVIDDQSDVGEHWRTREHRNSAQLHRESHVKIMMNLIDGPHNDVVQVYIDGSAGLVPGRPSADTQFDGLLRAGGQPADGQQSQGRTDDPAEVDVERQVVRNVLGGLLPIQ